MTRLAPLVVSAMAVFACGSEPAPAQVVVFDLDHTLFDNRPRTLRILREFADTLPPQRGELAASLRSLSTEQVHYLVSDTLANANIEDPLVVDEIIAFWKARFFVDDYVVFDEPLPCAVDFVQRVHARGDTVVYLTGRDGPNMEAGTRRSLTESRFPMDEATRLLMKSSFEEDDLLFKSRVLGTIDPLGHVSAVYENEPGNLAKMIEHWPDAAAFFLETDFDPRNEAPVPERATRLPDYCDAPSP